MQLERGEVGGTQAQATRHRDESPGWLFIRSLDFTSTAGGNYGILSQAVIILIYFIFRNQKEIYQWVNRDDQWVGEGHE